MKVRDSQRKKVYRWQNYYLFNCDTEHLALNTCNFIAENIFNAFGFNNKIPPILHSNSLKRCYFSSNKNIIRLMEEGRNRIILTHELAHALNRKLNYKLFKNKDKNIMSHGPEFIGIWMLLLNKWCNIPIKDLCRTADYEGVKYILYPNIKLKTIPQKKLCTSGHKNKNFLVIKKRPSNKQIFMQNLYPGGYANYFDEEIIK